MACSYYRACVHPNWGTPGVRSPTHKVVIVLKDLYHCRLTVIEYMLQCVSEKGGYTSMRHLVWEVSVC